MERSTRSKSPSTCIKSITTHNIVMTKMVGFPLMYRQVVGLSCSRQVGRSRLLELGLQECKQSLKKKKLKSTQHKSSITQCASTKIRIPRMRMGIYTMHGGKNLLVREKVPRRSQVCSHTSLPYHINKNGVEIIDMIIHQDALFHIQINQLLQPINL